jgi:phosphatidate cytidylyltransferase
MLRLRLLTAALLIPLLAIVLWLGTLVLAAVVTLVVLLAAAETAGLLRHAGIPVQRPLVVLFALAAVAETLAAAQGIGWALAAWLVLVAAAATLSALAAPDFQRAGLRWAGTLAGALYSLLLCFLLLIPLTVAPQAGSGLLVDFMDAGRAWLLLIVLGVWAYDTSAYVVGRLWPRGRLAPRISPAKTWSGAAGGTLGAIIAGAAIGALIGRPLEGAGMGVLIALGAPLGDLLESMLKRAAGVKDSGGLFPGHGGMLDRVDAFVLVAPLGWLYLALLGWA